MRMSKGEYFILSFKNSDDRTVFHLTAMITTLNSLSDHFPRFSFVFVKVIPTLLYCCEFQELKETEDWLFDDGIFVLHFGLLGKLDNEMITTPDETW